MPACLGNTATPHVLLPKKCHTRWYTASRAWPGQRSEEELSLAWAEAGKAHLCASTWMQHAKTLNCQPHSSEPPHQHNGAFSLHKQLEALRSLRANVFEILGSYSQNGKVPTYWWGGFSFPTSPLQQAQLSCMQSLCSPAPLLLYLATQILRHAFPPLLGSTW